MRSNLEGIIKRPKLKLFTLIFLGLFGLEGRAVLQSTIDEKWDKTLWSFMEKNGVKGHFLGEASKKIHYFTLYGSQFKKTKEKKTGPKGALVFLSGQGEPYIKYYEVFYDFFKMGYSPIYTFDHRGQGYSERFLKDPKKGYVDSFSNYVKDFDTFMKKVVLKDGNESLFLLTHSTGGRVTLLYLMEDQKRHAHFKKAAFGSPLIQMETAPFPYAVGKWIIQTLCKSKTICSQYYPGWSKFNAYLEFEGNLLTSNKERWYYSHRTARKVGDVWFNGFTIKWASEIFKSRDLFLKYKDKVKTPLLILQADNDALVRGDAHEDFCQNQAASCRLIKMKNSKHEIFNEKDSVRDKAIKHVDDFFQSTP